LAVVPYDEIGISADDVIIRRINPSEHVIPDQNRNCLRISSKAYSPSSGQNGGMSVDVEALIASAGHNPQTYVTTPVFTGSVTFNALQIRTLGLWIGYDPLATNPYHGEVWGAVRHNRFTKTQKSGLANAAQWYVQLPNVELA
jgi:hypothetical protein